MQLKHPLIIFDGVCNLCCGWVMFLIKLDKKANFKFASLQSEAAISVINTYGFSENEIDTVIFIKENKSFTHSDAVIEILSDLGGVWKLTKVFKLIPKSIRDFLYNQIAKRRYKLFGRKASCMIPNSSLQNRFYLNQ